MTPQRRGEHERSALVREQAFRALRDLHGHEMSVRTMAAYLHCSTRAVWSWLGHDPRFVKVRPPAGVPNHRRITSVRLAGYIDVEATPVCL